MASLNNNVFYASSQFVAAVKTDSGYIFLKKIGISNYPQLVQNINEAIGFFKEKSLKEYIKGMDDCQFKDNCKIYLRKTETILEEVK